MTSRQVVAIQPQIYRPPTATYAAITFAESSRALFSQPTVLDTLQRIVDLSLEAVRGCDGASVSFVQGEAVVTPVGTDDAVFEVDSLQYSSGEGPCLDAIAHEATFYSTDLSKDPRWPSFGPQAASHGMHSLLSLPLGGTENTLASLNLYAHTREAYDAPDRLGALAFSIHAGSALVAAEVLEGSMRAWAVDSDRLGRLERALPTRDAIAHAQGMLMAFNGIDADAAFTLLRLASLRLSLNLSEVARYVVETGEIPSGPVVARS